MKYIYITLSIICLLAIAQAKCEFTYDCENSYENCEEDLNEFKTCQESNCDQDQIQEGDIFAIISCLRKCPLKEELLTSALKPYMACLLLNGSEKIIKLAKCAAEGQKVCKDNNESCLSDLKTQYKCINDKCEGNLSESEDAQECFFHTCKSSNELLDEAERNFFECFTGNEVPSELPDTPKSSQITNLILQTFTFVGFLMYF
ncbi:hypothetical protein ABPG74_019748 [Tetrahymena malaccensis]